MKLQDNVWQYCQYDGVDSQYKLAQYFGLFTDGFIAFIIILFLWIIAWHEDGLCWFKEDRWTRRYDDVFDTSNEVVWKLTLFIATSLVCKYSPVYFYRFYIPTCCVKLVSNK